MKRLLILVFAIQCQLSVLCQKWEHIYGYPGTSESSKDVIECYDNGYLVSGSYEQLHGNWLIKTDVNGDSIWEKVINWGDVRVYGTKLAHDQSYNIIVASNIFSDSEGLWPLIVKLNPCGEKVWCRVFPNDDYSYGWYQDVLVLDNNDIVALVAFESTTANLDELYLDYIDSDGHLLWRQVYASQQNYPHIRECTGDEIHKFGDHYLIHGHCYYPYPSDTTHFFQRPLFIMLDSLFNEQWIIPFGVNDSLIGKALETIQLNDSTFMGVGMLRLEGTVEHTLIMYFDNKGNELGYVEIPNSSIGPDISQNYMNDIERINDTLFIGLTTFGIDDTEFFWGELIIDSTGTIYKKEFRPVGTNGQSKLVRTFDSKYIVGTGLIEGKTDWDIYLYKINENLVHDTMYPGTYTYDSLCPYPITSGQIDISDCLIVTGAGEVPTPQQYYAGLHAIPIRAFPNPARGVITFEFEHTEHHTDLELRCISVMGNRVHREKLYPSQGASRVDVTAWPPGLYLAVVLSNGRPAGRTKFAVR